MNTTKLESLGKVLSVLSSLAVPIVIGVFGWKVQQTISRDSLRKDYTDIALRVLSQAETNNQKELREWAVDMLDKNAPLPFTNTVRAQLLGDTALYASQFEFVPDAKSMEPPRAWIPLEKEKTIDEVYKNYSENMRLAGLDRLKLDILQDEIKTYTKLQRELEGKLQEIHKNAYGQTHNETKQK
jgi:hypothetical protein